MHNCLMRSICIKDRLGRVFSFLEKKIHMERFNTTVCELLIHGSTTGNLILHNKKDSPVRWKQQVINNPVITTFSKAVDPLQRSRKILECVFVSDSTATFSVLYNQTRTRDSHHVQTISPSLTNYTVTPKSMRT